MQGGFFQELNELIREGSVFVEHGNLLVFIVREVERPCSPAIQGAMQAAWFPGNLQDDIRQIESSRIFVLSDVKGLARFTFVDQFHVLEAGCFEIDVDPTVALQEVGFVEEVARNDSVIAHASTKAELTKLFELLCKLFFGGHLTNIFDGASNDFNS